MSRARSTGADDDVDIDYLLETLSPEELEKLGEELIDPDVSLPIIFYKLSSLSWSTINKERNRGAQNGKHAKQ